MKRYLIYPMQISFLMQTLKVLCIEVGRLEFYTVILTLIHLSETIKAYICSF